MNIVVSIKEHYYSLDSSSRRILVVMICSMLIVVTGYILAASHLGTLEVKRISREKVFAEIMLLQQRYREAASNAQRTSNLIASVTAEDSPARLIEQSGVVAKGGIQSKPLPRQEKNGVIEESAEVTVGGLSSNELVNLLYRLEQTSKPIAIRRLLIKTRFNDPAKVDAVLTLSLLRSSAVGDRK